MCMFGSSNDWDMILNNAHDPAAEFILIPIIRYENLNVHVGVSL